MHYLKSFIFGIFIACTALFVQVFFSVITEIFHFDLTLQSATEKSMFSVFLFFIITACIEEFLRYIIVQKGALIYIDESIKSIITHGIFIGLGFWVFESILFSLKNASHLNSLTTLVPVLIIHISMSILLITILKKFPKFPIIAVIIMLTMLHALCNMALYIFTI